MGLRGDQFLKVCTAKSAVKKIKKVEKKIEKIYFHLEIIAFELVALNTRFY